MNSRTQKEQITLLRLFELRQGGYGIYGAIGAIRSAAWSCLQVLPVIQGAGSK
jgi:hypothetical protein